MKANDNVKKDICEFFDISEIEFETLVQNEKTLDEYFYTSGETDLSYYEDIKYIPIALACYNDYSKNSCKAFAKYDNENPMMFSSIIDIGAGIGLTTLLLSLLFPKTKIIYQNIASKQKDYATHILGDNIIKTTELIQGDVAVCLEMFEHIKQPIDFLQKIIDECKPKYFLISNSFRSKSYGHFSKYLVDGKLVSNTKIGRMFNNILRKNNYKVLKSFWNNRPCIWEKVI